MVDKKESKETISRLIKRYELLTEKEKRDFNEANTRKNYILPMFQALGWDIREDVLEEDPAISGRVDYSFRLNNITQFLLEAKSISVNLEKEEWAKQTVEYGWNRGVPWVILTDFEGLKLFNSELNTSHPKPIFDFKYTEYLDKFEQLWLLSKESLENNLLDKTLNSYGIGSKRVRVNDVLATDMVNWRDELTSNFKSWNTGIDKQILNESIQRILDRLIFIRVVEDKGLEDKILWQTFQKWQSNGYKPNNFIESLIPIFRKFDQTYNSNLFIEHFCEKLETEGNPFKTIIPELYINKLQQVSYHFDAVNADVLGKVYEQYLGYLQKGQEDTGKRKKQGIYYTPSYIVDFIVRKTIGKKLEELNNYSEKHSIKILDPACGSGSFLINSFEYIDNYLRKLSSEDITDKNMAAIRKYRILSENIYGVDLDEQAIEIARLNLLLQAVVPNFKLPLLSKHIHIGNSLIEDKKHTQKAFEWKKEFSDVFERDNPGFDVIVGNPPYIKEFVNRNAFDNLRDSPYYQGKMDLWTLFACKSIDLLRDGGYLSFIAPNSWITNAGASILRDKILKEGEIQSFIDFGDYKVFQDAGIQTMVFVFKKQKPRDKYFINYIKIDESEIAETELVKKFVSFEKINFEPKKFIGQNINFLSKNSDEITAKITNVSNFQLTKKEVAQGIVSPQESVLKNHLNILSSTHKIGDGIFVLTNDEVQNLNLNNLEKKLIKPYFTTNQISQYFTSLKNNLNIIYTKSDINKNIDNFPNIKKHLDIYSPINTSSYKPYGLHRARDEKFFLGEKIVSVRKTDHPKFSYNNFPCYVSQTFFVIKSNRINLKYLTAILNSNVSYYWLLKKGKLQGKLLQIDKEPLLKIPITTTDKVIGNEVITLVDKLINLKAKLIESAKNSDEYIKIEGEIKKVNDKINQLVYKIYELNSDDIKIIESVSSATNNEY